MREGTGKARRLPDASERHNLRSQNTLLKLPILKLRDRHTRFLQSGAPTSDARITIEYLAAGMTEGQQDEEGIIIKADEGGQKGSSSGRERSDFGRSCLLYTSRCV